MASLGRQTKQALRAAIPDGRAATTLITAIERTGDTTAGTVEASATVVVDANKDVGDFRHVKFDNGGTLRTDTTAGNTLALAAYDVGAGAHESLVTVTAHATKPTLTLAASGGIAVSNAVTVANTMDIIAATSGGSDLGSTSGEWGNIYVGDAKGMYFGADQDASLLHDNDKGLALSVADNDATALDIKQSTNSYITVCTTDNAEKLTLASVQDVEINSGQTATDSVKIQAYDVGATAQETLITAAAHATTPILTLGASGGVNIVASDNTANAVTIKEGSNTYLDVTTTDDSEKLTLGSVQDVEVKCGQTAGDTVKIQAYDVDGTAYVDLITAASHGTDPTLTLAATGGITISNGVSVANTMDIVAATSGGSDLGSTSGEWGNIYVGDSKGVYFGAGQNASLLHDADVGLALSIADNDATALDIKEGSNSYLTFVTSDGSEQITLGKTLMAADLTLNSTNEVNLQIGGAAFLAIDDASISGHTAAADAAGKDVYIATAGGGTDSSQDGGLDSGGFSLTIGNGSAGGAADQAGGDAGDFAFTGGTGGACPSGDGNGGTGTSFAFTPGSGGSGSGTGVNGAPGSFHINGFARLTGAQTIDMSDAAVTLTRVPGTPTGTLLTGNWLLVDPNGNDENLLMPPEADMEDTMLFIKNTGGEHIAVQNDAGGAIGTIEDAEAALLHCDGTNWTIIQFVETT